MIPIYVYGSAQVVTPVIGSVVLPFAPEEGGTLHQILGTGFTPSSVIHVDGSPVATTFVNVYEIEFNAPAGTFGIVDLLVVNPGADSGTSGDGLFGYYAHKNLEALNNGTLSAAAFNAATGLTFARADTSPSNNVTLRSSASAVVSGIGADVARVFNDGTNRGLLIEQRQHNYAPHARHITAWTATGAGTQVDSAVTGPDGSSSSASHVSLSSGQTCNYFDLGFNSPNRSTMSCFQKSHGTVNGDMQMVYIDTANSVADVVDRAASLTWGFLAVAKLAHLREYILPVDCYDRSGNGGQTARARDVDIDFMMLELGDMATSCVTGGSSVTRDNDYVKWPSFPTANNRIRLFLRFAPMFSSSSQVAYINGSGLDLFEPAWTLFEAGGNHYMYIKDSDKKLYCKILSGSELVSTNTVSFTQWDELRFLITLGNGGSTLLKYSVNGGSWTDLVMSSFAGDATPPADMALLSSPVNNASSRSLPALLREIRSYPIDVTEVDV